MRKWNSFLLHPISLHFTHKYTTNNQSQAEIASDPVISLTFQLRGLNGKHVEGRQLEQPQLGYGNRCNAEYSSEFTEHLNGTLRERFHSGREEQEAVQEKN